MLRLKFENDYLNAGNARLSKLPRKVLEQEKLAFPTFKQRFFIKITRKNIVEVEALVGGEFIFINIFKIMF